jgi:hypothetical protein
MADKKFAYKTVGNIADILGKYMQEKKAKEELWQNAQRKGEMDLQFAIRKAQAESEADPINAIIKQATQQGQPRGMTSSDTSVVPVSTRTGIDSSKLLRGALSKKFGVPYEELRTPEERKEANQIEFEKEQQKMLAKTNPEELIKLTDDAIASVDKILNEKELGNYVGKFGFLPALPGTAKVTHRAEIARLKSLLALPNLKFLKGLGAMSDREFAVIQSSVSALDENMPIEDYKIELNRINKGLQGTKTRLKSGKLKPSLTSVNLEEVPEGVDKNDWDMASTEQRQEYLDYLGR